MNWWPGFFMANSAEMAPLQKKQMQFGLDSAKTAYGQAQEDRTFRHRDQRARLTELAEDVVGSGAEKLLTKNGASYVALVDAKKLD